MATAKACEFVGVKLDYRQPKRLIVIRPGAASRSDGGLRHAETLLSV